MNEADELDRLLSAVVEGDLTETDRLTLAALLRDDPEAQRQYRDYMLLVTYLQWERPVVFAIPSQTTSRKRWVRVVPSLAIAVGLFVAIGVALLFLGPMREVEAKPDVVSQLADWNLAIADAPDPESRRERFLEFSETLTSQLARADLQPDERQLANALYQRAAMLSKSNDPMTTAEQLDGISEELHHWLMNHTDANPRRAQAIERHYLRFIERSLVNIRKACESRPNEELQTRVDKVTDVIARRSKTRVLKETERAAKKAAR